MISFLSSWCFFVPSTYATTRRYVVDDISKFLEFFLFFFFYIEERCYLERTFTASTHLRRLLKPHLVVVGVDACLPDSALQLSPTSGNPEHQHPLGLV